MPSLGEQGRWLEDSPDQGDPIKEVASGEVIKIGRNRAEWVGTCQSQHNPCEHHSGP